MSRHVAIASMALWSVCVIGTATAQSPAAASTREIDRDIWAFLVATVANDDIIGMGRAYFPEAVLVMPSATLPIKVALEGWGRDMVAARAKGARATVELRFSRRQDDSTTAFEVGIFKYTVISKDGVRTPAYFPFEELLVKTNGKWRVLMEHQFPAVTQEEWNKLPQGG